MESNINNYNKHEDLGQIFDKRYNAKREGVNRVKKSEENFNKRMFGIIDKEKTRREMRDANSPKGQAQELRQRMDNANTFNRNSFGA